MDTYRLVWTWWAKCSLSLLYDRASSFQVKQFPDLENIIFVPLMTHKVTSQARLVNTLAVASLEELLYQLHCCATVLKVHFFQLASARMRDVYTSVLTEITVWASWNRVLHYRCNGPLCTLWCKDNFQTLASENSPYNNSLLHSTWHLMIMN